MAARMKSAFSLKSAGVEPVNTVWWRIQKDLWKSCVILVRFWAGRSSSTCRTDRKCHFQSLENWLTLFLQAFHLQTSGRELIPRKQNLHDGRDSYMIGSQFAYISCRNLVSAIIDNTNVSDLEIENLYIKLIAKSIFGRINKSSNVRFIQKTLPDSKQYKLRRIY